MKKGDTGRIVFRSGRSRTGVVHEVLDNRHIIIHDIQQDAVWKFHLGGKDAMRVDGTTFPNPNSGRWVRRQPGYSAEFIPNR